MYLLLFIGSPVWDGPVPPPGAALQPSAGVAAGLKPKTLSLARSVADFDGGGLLDVLFADPNVEVEGGKSWLDYLAHNVGERAFESAPVGPFGIAGYKLLSALVGPSADIDSDGDADVLMVNTPTSSKVTRRPLVLLQPSRWAWVGDVRAAFVDQLG